MSDYYITRYRLFQAADGARFQWYGDDEPGMFGNLVCDKWAVFKRERGNAGPECPPFETYDAAKEWVAKRETPDQENARNLAVAYDAFSDALRADDKLGMRVWAWLLLNAQEKTRVEFYSADWLRKVGRYDDETERAA